MKQELLDAIALNTFLSALPPAARDAFFEGTITRTARRGEVVYRPGDTPAAALVVSGLLRAYVVAADGRQATIWYGRSGDLLALEAIFTPPRHLQLQAFTEASAIVWPLELLGDRLRTDGALLWGVTAEISRRLSLMFEELSGDIFGSVRQRLSRHVLELAAHDDASGALVAQVSAPALALAVGTAREVVSRALRDLADEGVIKTERGAITILDATRLYDESCAHEKA